MKKFKLYGSALAVLLMLILTACGNTGELEEEIVQLENEITRLEDENLRLENELSDLEEENLRLEEEYYYLTQEPEEEPLVGIPFEIDDLIGDWSNGTGDLIFGLSPNVRADEISFSEDNTVSISGQKMTGPDREGDIYEETGVWQIADGDLLEAFGHTLIVEINGNILTMTNVESENVRTWNQVESSEESDDVDEDDGEQDDDDDDDDSSSSSSSSSSDVDWRQFLEDYDAFTTRRLRDPLGLLEEGFEWIERASEIQDTLEGDDWLEFFEESLRIGTRTE